MTGKWLDREWDTERDTSTCGALECGVREYIFKCDAGKELVAAVRTAIQGGQYLSANARLALEKTQRSIINDEETR